MLLKIFVFGGVALLEGVLGVDMVARTVLANNAVLGRAPEPTAAPGFVPNLLRRDSGFTSICGYINGNACTAQLP